MPKKRLKNYFRKLLLKIFPDPMTDKELAQGLYAWILKNRKSYFDFYCPVCGMPISVKDITEEHFLKDHVVLIYQCNQKCRMNVQKRYTLDFDEIEKM
jgi:hypothetical protein